MNVIIGLKNNTNINSVRFHPLILSPDVCTTDIFFILLFVVRYSLFIIHCPWGAVGVRY
jgi:hypothetical protein